MVLSSTYSLPPTRYSRDVLQKLADIADQLTKVVDNFCAISKDFNTITTNNFTCQYEQTSSFITTMTKTEHHNTKVLSSFPPSPSLHIRQYTSLPTLCLAKLTENKSIDELSPSKSSPLINESTTNTKNDIINTIIINESNNPTSNTKNDISETTTEFVTEIHVSPVSDFPANPTCKTPKLRHDIAIFHQTTIHATYGVATFIDDNLTIFRRQETFPHGHQCPPPKFIFLQTEPEPPWKLFTLDYGNLGLEDKAVFQDGSIDTCMTVLNNIMIHACWNNKFF